MRPVTWLRVGLLVALLVAVYWVPIRNQLVFKWIDDANWSHGWLIPVFSLYFLWSRREQLAATPIRPSYLGAVILALSLAAYFGFWWVMPMGYPRALSMVGAVFGVTLLLAGWRVMRIAWFPILFLVLAVPLPDRVYVEITRPLREIASQAAAALMPFFADGLYTEAQAVVIDYIYQGQTGQLNVEEACAGMRLLMAFVTLGVAMAYLKDRPAWQRIVLVVCCLPIAIFCNTLRVMITGLLHVHGYADWARGTAHEMLGIVMILVALGLYAMVSFLVSHLFVEEAEPAPDAPTA